MRGAIDTYCRKQLVELQANLDELEGLGAEILVLSTSSTQALRKLVATEGLEYTFLVDPEAEVIDRYGLRNPDHPPSYGVAPHPATLVIDREGMIRFKRVDVDYRVRPSSSELVEVVRELTEAG